MTSRHPALDQALAHSLIRERAYHDTCRAALDAMVAGADEHVVTGEDVSASGADAEVLGYVLRSKAKEMRELPEGPLFFGKLDFESAREAAGEHAGQSYHLGRLRITEHPAAPPLVVDWRAPVSRAFYQASSRAPQGVAVRRRFGWAPGSLGDSADLTGLEDEHLAQARPQQPSRILAGEIERPVSARCATSPRPSSPNRMSSYEAISRPRSVCRAPRAPARRPSDCTGPRTSSTPTRSASAAAAC